MRSACMQQASYLEGGLLMWMLPLYLHVNKKSDDDFLIFFIKAYVVGTCLNYLTCQGFSDENLQNMLL